jgi:hypothetical protein
MISMLFLPTGIAFLKNTIDFFNDFNNVLEVV